MSDSDTPLRDAMLAEWLDILAESEAEAEAGLIVPGEEIMRDLRESAARLEAKLGKASTRETASRR